MEVLGGGIISTRARRTSSSERHERRSRRSSEREERNGKRQRVEPSHSPSSPPPAREVETGERAIYAEAALAIRRCGCILRLDQVCSLHVAPFEMLVPDEYASMEFRMSLLWPHISCTVTPSCTGKPVADDLVLFFLY